MARTPRSYTHTCDTVTQTVSHTHEYEHEYHTIGVTGRVGVEAYSLRLRYHSHIMSETRQYRNEEHITYCSAVILSRPWGAVPLNLRLLLQ